MTQVERAIWQGQYLYFHAKPLHPGWVASMQFRTIQTFLRSGWIRHANKQAESPS